MVFYVATVSTLVLLLYLHPPRRYTWDEYRPFGKAARLAKRMRAEMEAEAAGDPPPEHADEFDDLECLGADGDETDGDDTDGDAAAGGDADGGAVGTLDASGRGCGRGAGRAAKKTGLSAAEEGAVFRLALASLWTSGGGADEPLNTAAASSALALASSSSGAGGGSVGELGVALAAARKRLRLAAAERDEAVSADESLEVDRACGAQGLCGVW